MYALKLFNQIPNGITPVVLDQNAVKQYYIGTSQCPPTIHLHIAKNNRSILTGWFREHLSPWRWRVVDYKPSEDEDESIRALAYIPNDAIFNRECRVTMRYKDQLGIRRNSVLWE